MFLTSFQNTLSYSANEHKIQTPLRAVKWENYHIEGKQIFVVCFAVALNGLASHDLRRHWCKFVLKCVLDTAIFLYIHKSTGVVPGTG